MIGVHFSWLLGRAIARFVAPLVVALGVTLLPLVAYAGTITVNGTSCKLPDAITAANTDAATNGCTKGSGADMLLLTAPIYLLATGPYTIGRYDGMTATPGITTTIVISGGVDGAIIERSGPAHYRLFYIGSSGDLTLQTVTVRYGNSEVDGGAIYNHGGRVTLVESRVFSNTAHNYGGGIQNDENGSLSVTNSQILSNTAKQYGGGITNISASTMTVTSSLISGNRADKGGGIYNDFKSKATVSDSDFTANAATAGAGLYNVNTATFTNTDFISNRASYGAGLYNKSTATLTNSAFISNTATNSGAGIYNEGSMATLANSTFISNTAAYGAGILNHASTSSIANSTFISNTADNGGGMLIFNGVAILTDTHFIANVAIKVGGGILSVGSEITLTNVEIRANRAILSGGGLDLESDPDSGQQTTTIVSSRFLDNEAGDYGSAVQQFGGAISISQSCIVNNTDTAVNYVGGDPIDAGNNWWGAPNGPSGAGPGAGDSVSSSVTFTAFLTSTVVGCATRQATPTPNGSAIALTPPPAEEKPGTVESDASAAERLLIEGVGYHDAGDYDKAVAAFTEAIRLNPDLEEAYVKRAAAYLRLGENEAAIADSDEAIRRNPQDADAYLYRGVAHAYLDDFEAALPDLSEAIRLDPQNVNAHVYRGATNFFLERYAAAVQDCTDALHLSGGYFLPVETCINVMGKLASPSFDHVAAAIQDYDEAIRLNPDFAAAYLFRGLAQRTSGDIEAAIQDLEEGLRLDPSLSDILLFAWSSVYTNPVDPDAAIKELESALALVEPDSVLANLVESTLEQLRPGE